MITSWTAEHAQANMNSPTWAEHGQPSIDSPNIELFRLDKRTNAGQSSCQIIHAYMHTYIHHTYIHTYIHAYIHTYNHTVDLLLLPGSTSPISVWKDSAWTTVVGCRTAHSPTGEHEHGTGASAINAVSGGQPSIDR